MHSTDYIRLLELAASRICHDLISPVGAVSNGVEILEELGPDAGADVISLISFSAGQANGKLRALRMVYGVGGADESIRMDEVHDVFGAFIAGDKRLSQDWDPRSLNVSPQKGMSKLLLACLILTAESLPKGGIVSAQTSEDGAILIRGTGDNAHLNPDILRALRGDTPAPDLDPKLVHACITGLFAKHYHFGISTEAGENNFIVLRLKSSAVSL